MSKQYFAYCTLIIAKTTLWLLRRQHFDYCEDNAVITAQMWIFAATQGPGYRWSRDVDVNMLEARNTKIRQDFSSWSHFLAFTLPSAQ